MGADVGVGVGIAADVAAGVTGTAVGLSLPSQAFKSNMKARVINTRGVRGQTMNEKRLIRRKEEVGIRVLLVMGRQSAATLQCASIAQSSGDQIGLWMFKGERVPQPVSEAISLLKD